MASSVPERMEGLVKMHKSEAGRYLVQFQIVNWVGTSPGSADTGRYVDESHAGRSMGMGRTMRVAVIRAIREEGRAVVQSVVRNEALQVLRNTDVPPG